MCRNFRVSMLILAFAVCSFCWPGASQAQVRPFSGAASGSVAGQIPPNGLEVHAAGQATHLGKFTRVEQIYVDGTGAITGQVRFVAANGDALCATITGQFISQTTAVGEYQFVGGTGRFSSATGQASFQAVTPDGQKVDIQFAGKISY
jgi:hypothetical protein